MLIQKAYMSSTPGPTISFSSVAVFTPGLKDATIDDVYMSWPQTGAIFSSTKCPETAKLFVSYLMDDEWQRIITGSGFATRKTYDTRHVFEQEPNMNATGYLNFAQNRELVEMWRFQFETLLGLPQGADPNYLTF
jgi:ABC-type Fe3+ transport system substrate-binding protein